MTARMTLSAVLCIRTKQLLEKGFSCKAMLDNCGYPQNIILGLKKAMASAHITDTKTSSVTKSESMAQDD
jgi:hypothetical protein